MWQDVGIELQSSWAGLSGYAAQLQCPERYTHARTRARAWACVGVRGRARLQFFLSCCVTSRFLAGPRSILISASTFRPSSASCAIG